MAWKTRSNIPPYVYETLKAMPKDTHPMTMFSQAILSLQHGSVFAKNYQDGMKSRLLGSDPGR
jgi:citrate synthase